MVEHMMFLVGAIDHFTRWETSESISKIVLSRVSREQGRIRKIWIGNTMSTVGCHTPNEEISLVGLDNMIATQ